MAHRIYEESTEPTFRRNLPKDRIDSTSSDQHSDKSDSYSLESGFSFEDNITSNTGPISTKFTDAAEESATELELFSQVGTHPRPTGNVIGRAVEFEANIQPESPTTTSSEFDFEIQREVDVSTRDSGVPKKSVRIKMPNQSSAAAAAAAGAPAVRISEGSSHASSLWPNPPGASVEPGGLRFTEYSLTARDPPDFYEECTSGALPQSQSNLEDSVEVDSTERIKSESRSRMLLLKRVRRVKRGMVKGFKKLYSVLRPSDGSVQTGADYRDN